MTKKISQRDALRLRKKVKELEAKLRELENNWVGTRIDSWTLTGESCAKVKTAKVLGYTVFLNPTYSGTEVEIKAVKL